METLGSLMKRAQFRHQNERLKVEKFESMEHRIVAQKSWFDKQNTLMQEMDL